MKTYINRAAFSVIAVLTLAAVVLLGSPGEALAATVATIAPGKGSLLDFVSMAAPSLVALRLNVHDIESRAAAKMAEAVDGLTVDQLRKIEDEHAAILKEAEPIREQIATEERRLKTPVVDPDAGNERADPEAVLAAERERSAAILDLADKHGFRTLGDKAVRTGQSLDAFRASLLTEISKKEPTITGHNRVEGPAGGEKRGEAIVNALLHRHDMRAYKLDDASRDFRGMSLVDIARDCLEANGRSTRGMSRNDIAAEALAAGQRSGGMHSTSDFPFVLANVANKTLRAAYEQSPQTFRPLVREVSVPDFKSVSRVQMGEAPAFERVNEHGEFERGTIGEGREQYSIATYGKVVAITRQVIINDDLSAFTRVPQAFGFQAANLESDLVWAQIVGNPVMGDGQTLFHSTHGNVLTPAGISADSVAAGFEAMRLQKGLDGRTLLNIMPAYIIAPVAAQMKVSQFLTAITANQTANTVPDYIRTVIPIIEPRLDGGFTNPVTGAAVAGNRFNWFMAAAPGMVDTVELAYLEGQQGVYTETRTGFDVDGVEVKVRLDAGSKVIDWRAFARNLATGL
jgi:hypothetical protein